MQRKFHISDALGSDGMMFLNGDDEILKNICMNLSAESHFLA